MPEDPVGQRQQVAIQKAMGAPGRSALSKYQELVVGSRGLPRLLLHELVITLTSWVPGALGLVLRRLTYPLLLGSVGRNVTFGCGVVLRHPGKVHIGPGQRHRLGDPTAALGEKQDEGVVVRLSRRERL